MKENVANKVTLTRIILSLIIILVLMFPLDTIGINLPKLLINGIYMDSKYLISGVLLILTAATDFIDGSLAKKNNTITEHEKTMDAIADEVLISSTLIILSSQGFVPPAITVVIVLRNVFTNTFKTIAAVNGKTIGAIQLEKYKTACLMLGITLTLFYNLPFEYLGINVAGYLLLVATVLSIVSGIQYYNMTKKYFRTKE